MAEGDTLVNALLGAVVSGVLFFLPFSPLLGGVVAGYLESGGRGDGLRVGAISGLIALLPLVGLVVLVVGAGSLFLFGGLPLGIAAVGAVFLVLVLVTIAVYAVGLSALGGWLGNYLRTDAAVGA